MANNFSNKNRGTPRNAYLTPQCTKFISGCDPHLLPRIKQYLMTSLEPRKIDVSVLIKHLQMHYSEYKRKKKGPFEKSVIRAYNYALKSTSLKGDGDSEDSEVRLVDESGSSSCSDIDYPDRNLANDSLRDLYGKNTSTPVQTTPATLRDAANAEDLCRRKPDKKVERNCELIGPSRSSVSKNTEKEEEKVIRKVNKKRKLADNQNEPSKKVKHKDIAVQKSSTTFADIGGNESSIQDICKLIVHLKHPEVYDRLGITPPRGLLLHGPPGCGKTLLAHAIAGELDLPFIKIGSTEIVTGISGESEEKIRDLFEMAVQTAPCVLFIDEIDSITPKRETAQREMERRIVSQLLTCLDDLNAKGIDAQVLVIGATNRPDALDPALRRAGRFDREIRIGIPDVGARHRILEVLCRNLRLAPGFDCPRIASLTPGYVGADLMALTREAAMFAIDRVFCNLRTFVVENVKLEMCPDSDGTTTNNNMSHSAMRSNEAVVKRDSFLSSLTWLRDQPPLTEEQMENLYVEMSDFESALKVVQPSAMREGFATVPDVTWDDVGALCSVREELKLAILLPIRYPEMFENLGLTTPAGILLYGPPGCGKTLLAKAIANESGVNFISVKGPELLNMYVGESERAVRQCFQRAQNSAPCVIFFDELDALCPRRSDSTEGSVNARVVNQLLTEMDGIEKRRNVFILGATNRPDIIDPAVLRPGRLDKALYVGIPTPEDRFEILKTLTKNGTRPHIASDVSLREIAEDKRCNAFTGADLAALVREASVLALQEAIGDDGRCNSANKTYVEKQHFEDAFKKVRASSS